MSAPSPPLGPQSDWCVPYLPLSQRQDSLWSGVAVVGAACTLSGWWYCFNGIWPRAISQGGSARCTRAGGAGLACFAVGGPLQEGPCSREAGPSEGWIHRSTALGVCSVQASSARIWFPLEFQLGDGRGKLSLPVPLFPCPSCPSGAPELSHPASSHPTCARETSF